MNADDLIDPEGYTFRINYAAGGRTGYPVNGQWYTVTRLEPGWYRAEVLGQLADGPTPSQAVVNAARKHAPMSTDMTGERIGR